MSSTGGAARTAWQLANPHGPGGPSFFYVARHFVSVVALKWYGKMLLTVWTGYFAWLLAARRKRRRKAAYIGKRSKAAAERGRAGENARAKKKTGALSRLLSMMRPALKGERRWIVAYVTSLSVRVLITVKIADLSGRLGGYMAVKKWDTMFRGQAWFGIWCMLAAGTTSMMKYLEKRMAMSVRNALYQRLLSHYLDDELHFYRLDLDDASSRLTSDLSEFSNELTHNFGFIVKPVVDVTYLTAVLAVRLGIKSMATLYIFIIVASRSLQRAKQLLPRSLKECAVEASQLESSLRSAHDRLHTYREQIALQTGTQRERSALKALFARVVSNQHEMLWSKAIMDLLNSYVLRYGGMMCGFSILIEPIYRNLGKYANASFQDITAGMMADINLLNSLSTAIGDLADSFVSVPRLRGLAERVYELENHMADLPPRPPCTVPGSNADGIRCSNVTIRPPVEGVAPLFTGLDLTVGEGQHTVIRGPNGVGKTSLFRTLGGLWDGGEGADMSLPPSFFIVPQESYFPVGTLAAQISYPDPAGPLALDAEARAQANILLEAVDLDAWLRDHNFDLDSVQDWHSVLSGGQKQRLAWVRLFYHKPAYALIDEGTSAVDRQSVDQLFLYAKKLGITLFTISHHDAVDIHHTRALDLAKGGVWSWSEDVTTPRDTENEVSDDENQVFKLLGELRSALSNHAAVQGDDNVQRILQSCLDASKP